MSTAMESVQDFMAAFVAAWPEGDATKLAPFFNEDAVYHNIPLTPVKGREAIRATLAGFMGIGGQVGVDIVHIVADGPIVMTERVDHFIGTERTISLPVMGILEVHDGQITAWRDYFDLNQFVSLMPDEA
jgi:limonene-1,2-epoxide hydrolase